MGGPASGIVSAEAGDEGMMGNGEGKIAFGGCVDRCLDDSSRPITRRTRFGPNQKGNRVAG